MVKPIFARLADWPKDKTGLPLFTCSGDAHLYAQLIEGHPAKQNMLHIARQDVYIKLRQERHSQQPGLQRMCDLSVKAQLYRESLDEVQRIKDEGFPT